LGIRGPPPRKPFPNPRMKNRRLNQDHSKGVFFFVFVFLFPPFPETFFLLKKSSPLLLRIIMFPFFGFFPPSDVPFFQSKTLSSEPVRVKTFFSCPATGPDCLFFSPQCAHFSPALYRHLFFFPRLTVHLSGIALFFFSFSFFFFFFFFVKRLFPFYWVSFLANTGFFSPDIDQACLFFSRRLPPCTPLVVVSASSSWLGLRFSRPALCLFEKPFFPRKRLLSLDRVFLPFLRFRDTFLPSTT